MTDPVRCPASDFDPFSDAYGPATAIEVNRRLRSGPPVFSNCYGGFWTLARHADVVEGFRQDGKQLSARRTVLEDGTVVGGVVLPPMSTGLGFMEMDPPSYTQIRKVLNPWFSSGAIESRRPRIDELARALLNRRIEAGTVDMLDELIRPLAGVVTLELLGLPLEGLARFAFPLQRVDHNLTHRESMGTVWDAVKDQIAVELIARKANGPHDDLVDALASLEVSGELISDQLLVESVLLILIGGVETVAGAFSGALYHLHEHPEHRRALADNPALLPTAFQEYVRYVSPTTQNARTAMCDFELAGQKIRRGDVVYFNLYAANHDEEVFDQAEEVVLDRWPNPHLGLGVGLHRCLGAHIASAVWTSMMGEVLSRIPDYTLDTANLHWYPVCGTSNGCERMPAIFPPGPKRHVSVLVEQQVDAAIASLYSSD